MYSKELLRVHSSCKVSAKLTFKPDPMSMFAQHKVKCKKINLDKFVVKLGCEQIGEYSHLIKKGFVDLEKLL